MQKRLLVPAYTGTLNDKPLRLFKAPLQGAHLPWHATEDLQACLNLPRDLRRAFRQRLMSSEWKSDVRTVATADGIVTIAPHFIAQGMIGAMTEAGYATARTEILYAREAKRAWDLLYPGGNYAEAIGLLVAAVHNQDGGAR